MNKSKNIIAALAAVFVIGLGGLWVFGANEQTEEPVQNTQAQVQQIEEKPTITISEDQKTVSYEGVSGKTALEILKAGTNVSVQDSDFGEFVTGIGGVEADSTKEYWSFFVNGEYASEGAGTYQTTDGELIEWKLEQLQ